MHFKIGLPLQHIRNKTLALEVGTRTNTYFHENNFIKPGSRDIPELSKGRLHSYLIGKTV